MKYKCTDLIASWN